MGSAAVFQNLTNLGDLVDFSSWLGRRCPDGNDRDHWGACGFEFLQPGDTTGLVGIAEEEPHIMGMARRDGMILIGCWEGPFSPASLESLVSR